MRALFDTCILIDYLNGIQSEFLEYFPGVNNTQVQDVLHHAAKSLDAA